MKLKKESFERISLYVTIISTIISIITGWGSLVTFIRRFIWILGTTFIGFELGGVIGMFSSFLLFLIPEETRHRMKLPGGDVIPWLGLFIVGVLGGVSGIIYGATSSLSSSDGWSKFIWGSGIFFALVLLLQIFVYFMNKSQDIEQ